MASSSVNSVSTVPCTKRVGTVMSSTRSAGPRLRNQSSSSLLSSPVSMPLLLALVMCGSTRPPPVSERIDAHPALTVRLLNSEVSRECHAMPGTIASTRQSMPAVTSWMPPP